LTTIKEMGDLLGKGNEEQSAFNLGIEVPWRLYLRNGKPLYNV
jgi:hypothetical protein